MPQVEAPNAPAVVPTYKDGPLPEACPPADAIAPGNILLLRLVRTDHPTADDFLSCRLEGKTPPRKQYDPCVWRAVSFFLDSTPAEKIADVAKYRNHADKKYVAFVRANQQSGVIKVGPDGHHVSFWMYEQFQPETVVEKVEPL